MEKVISSSQVRVVQCKKRRSWAIKLKPEMTTPTKKRKEDMPQIEDDKNMDRVSIKEESLSDDDIQFVPLQDPLCSMKLEDVKLDKQSDRLEICENSCKLENIKPVKNSEQNEPEPCRIKIKSVTDLKPEFTLEPKSEPEVENGEQNEPEPCRIKIESVASLKTEFTLEPKSEPDLVNLSTPNSSVSDTTANASVMQMSDIPLASDTLLVIPSDLSYCRVCMQKCKGHFMVPLISMVGSEESTISIQDMIFAVSGVQVKENDGLPSEVCMQCLQRVLNAYLLKKQCEFADKTFRRILFKKNESENTQPTTPKSKVNEQSNQNELDLDVDEKVHCRECNTTMSKTEVNAHLLNCKTPRAKNVTSDENHVFICDICSNIVDPVEIESHKKSCTNYICDEKIETIVVQPEIIITPKIPTITVTSNELKEHIKSNFKILKQYSQTSNLISCKKCQHLLYVHEISDHETICQGQSLYESELAIESDVQFVEQPVDIVGITSNQSEKALPVSKSSAKIISFKKSCKSHACLVCEKWFTHVNDVRHHMNTHMPGYIPESIDMQAKTVDITEDSSAENAANYSFHLDNNDLDNEYMAEENALYTDIEYLEDSDENIE